MVDEQVTLLHLSDLQFGKNHRFAGLRSARRGEVRGGASNNDQDRLEEGKCSAPCAD
jgi:hypothetical protein